MAQTVGGLTRQNQGTKLGRVTRSQRAAPVVEPGQDRVGLAPAASPVDTYTAPQRAADPVAPSNTNGWLELADVLKGLEPALASYGNYKHEQHVDAMSREAQERMFGLTLEEAEKLRASGELALRDDPYYTDALNQFYGQKRAAWRTQDIQSRLRGISTAGEGQPSNAFDPVTGDIDQFLADAQREDMEVLQGGTAQQAFSEMMTGQYENLRSQGMAARDEAAIAQSMDVGTEAYLSSLDEAAARNLSAAETVELMRSNKATLKERFGLSNSQIDEIEIEVAGKLAEQGDYAAVYQLLMAPRGDVPAIGRKSGELQRVSKIIETAQKKFLENSREDNLDALVTFDHQAATGTLDRDLLKVFRKRYPGVITTAKAEQWLTQNELNITRRKEELAKAQAKMAAAKAAQDHNAQLATSVDEMFDNGLGQFIPPTQEMTETGKPKDLSVQAAQKAAVERFIYDRSPRIAKTRGETPEQTFNREAEWFSLNGMVNPQWKNVINAGGLMATRAAFGTDSLPKNVQEGYRLYRQLRAANPALLQAHVSGEQTRLFYDTARIAETYMGMDATEALSFGSDAVQKAMQPNAPDLQPRYNDFKKAVKRSELHPDVVNQGDVSAGIIEIGGAYIAAGLPVEVALEEAQARYDETHEVINGWSVYVADPAARVMPQRLAALGAEPLTFPQVVEQELMSSLKKAGIEDSEDYVPEFRGGKVYFKELRAGIPVVSPTLGTKGLSMEELLEKQVDRAERSRRAKEAQAAEDAVEAAKPWTFSIHLNNKKRTLLSVGGRSPAYGSKEWTPRHPTTGEPLINSIPDKLRFPWQRGE
jgi:hypothetical protein